jgi:hypothetical protein
MHWTPPGKYRQKERGAGDSPSGGAVELLEAGGVVDAMAAWVDAAGMVDAVAARSGVVVEAQGE